MTKNKQIIPGSFYYLIGMCLFLLPLIDAWMLYPLAIENVQTPYSALGGILPWSDAEAYYSGAKTLLETGYLDPWNTRRPLNAILFSIRLWLANDNFQIALIIQALLCGLSCLLVVKSISRTFGKISSIATLFILFLYAAIFIPTTLSETLGLTLGCFGFVFLWEGVQIKRTWLFFYAGLILMVGLNARAGAFFILPFIILWLAYHFKRDPSRIYTFNWRLPLSFTSGLLVALLFNWVIIKLYDTTGEGALHGNFGLVLFSFISGGKNWTHAYTVYPEIFTKSEAEISKFLYIKSYEILKENPFLILSGFLENLGKLFKVLLTFFQPELPTNPLLKLLIYFPGMTILFLGFWRLKKLYKINQNEIGLIIVVLIGMFISAGTIWKDGGFRVFAVTIPFIAATLGIVVGSYRRTNFQTQHIISKKNSSPWEVAVAYALSSLLLILSLIGSLFVRTPLPFDSSHFSCAANETTIITKKIFSTPQVNLAIKANQFRKTVLQSAIEDKETFLRILKPDILKTPVALGLVYDLNTRGLKYIIASVDLFSDRHPLIGLCTTQISGAKRILQVTSSEVFSEK